MTANPGRHQDPRGFGGQVQCLSELIPTHGRILRLPDQGERDGGFLRLPEGAFDGAVVAGLSDSLGALMPFLHTLRQRLNVGAPVVFDVANAQSIAALRRGLETRLRNLDPVGAIGDPERSIHRQELLPMLAAAGFVVHDVFDVPSLGEGLSPGFAAALLQQGIIPFVLRHGAPPRRFWITATAMPAPRGSVLIGPGGVEDIARTRASLDHLPPDIEVVLCDGDDEAQAFLRGISRAAGDTILFLRAGATIDEASYTALRARLWRHAAVVAAREGAPIAPGDVCGLMTWRQELLALGSAAGRTQAPQVAYEDLCLMLDAQTGGPAPVDVEGFVTPPVPVATTAADEARAMLAAWNEIGLDRDPATLVPYTEPLPAPWSGRQPRLSLVMMVKDEAQTLARCLRSVRDRVDEIIVVDTGSSDDTVAIAESFGAQVLESPWADDFSAPRNVGMSAATGDWILVLDADEALAPDQGDRLRELLRDGQVAGYQLVLQNEYGDGTKTMGVAILRLFRNLPGIHYQNRIHEQVLPSLLAVAGPMGMRLAMSDLVVLHDGYVEERMRQRGKNERNDRLFKLQLQDAPDDVYSLYKYGDALRRMPGRRDEARVVLERAWDALRRQPQHLPGQLPYAGEIAALLALELGCQGDFTRARATVAQAFRDYMPTPNLHYIAAGIANHEGRHEEAIAHYRACFGYAGRVLVVPVQEGLTSYVSLTGMAQAYLRLGDHARARELLEAARAAHPDYEVTALALSSLYVQSDEPGLALQVLTKHLERNPDSAGACQQAAVILSRLGCVDQARALGQRAVKLLERAQLGNEAERTRELVASLG
ncbi:MAG: glycosyltransferase [Planctomycetota bacterium]